VTRRRSRRGHVAASAALLAGALLLSGCGFTAHSDSGRPACTRDAVDVGSGQSTLDPEGVACIVEQHRARFDLSAGPIGKAALGVPLDEFAPEVASDDGSIDLEIVAPAGSIRVSTDHIAFAGDDVEAVVRGVTYFLVADSPEEFFGLLRAGVDDYGLDADAVERWIDDVQDDPDGASDFAFAPGTALGLNVSYDLRYDAAKAKQVVIVEVYPL